MKLIGANASAAVSGVDELPGKSNDLIGNDPKKWRTNVPDYANVRYHNIYPGVDLVYYGNQGGQLEYDFVVAPGADPAAIPFALSGGLEVGGRHTAASAIGESTEAGRGADMCQTVTGIRFASTRILDACITASVSGHLSALAARLGKAKSKFLVQNWRYGMMKMALTVLLVLCTVNVTLGDDVAFRNVKVADAKGKQADASLIFSESNKAIVVRVADRDFVSIPYDKIDKLSYEYTKKHRVTQGAIVMVASLGAGAVVMLTKSKSHWLYIDYHQESGPSSLVLRMDKKNYKTILDTAKAQTGKQVEFLGDAKGKR